MIRPLAVEGGGKRRRREGPWPQQLRGPQSQEDEEGRRDVQGQAYNALWPPIPRTPNPDISLGPLTALLMQPISLTTPSQDQEVQQDLPDQQQQRLLAGRLLLAIHPTWLPSVLRGEASNLGYTSSDLIAERYVNHLRQVLSEFSSWQQVLNARLPNRGLIVALQREETISGEQLATDTQTRRKRKASEFGRGDEAEHSHGFEPPGDLPDDKSGTCPGHWAVTPTLGAAYDVSLNEEDGEASLPGWLQIKALAALRDRAREGEDDFDALLRVTDAHDATTLHRACRYGRKDVVSWICGLGFGVVGVEEEATAGESAHGSSRVTIGALLFLPLD